MEFHSPACHLTEFFGPINLNWYVHNTYTESDNVCLCPPPHNEKGCFPDVSSKKTFSLLRFCVFLGDIKIFINLYFINFILFLLGKAELYMASCSSIINIVLHFRPFISILRFISDFITMILFELMFKFTFQPKNLPKPNFFLPNLLPKPFLSQVRLA